jgi:hypothetical protein
MAGPRMKVMNSSPAIFKLHQPTRKSKRKKATKTEEETPTTVKHLLSVQMFLIKHKNVNDCSPL